MTSIILKNYKQTTRITANLLKCGSNLSRRQYATTLEDYKITWTRPKKESYLIPEKSGDQGIDISVKASDIPSIYSESPEMKDASDIVKTRFMLNFLPYKNISKVKMEKFVNIVQRYDNDTTSPEVKIAYLTGKIYVLREVLIKYPKNSKIRVALKELIDKRRSLLARLRKKDYRCFEYVLEKMNLVYKPFPEPPTQITKKESLTRLTEKYCDKIVQEKLDSYKAELKAQQKDFFAEKAEKLAFIREEEIACGLKPTISEEDIARAKQKAMEYQT
ncbi:28S ribosomal protein S15, mitochondrial [Odontomachus brunneus]|uniref:28S ribosomal protein S15, mitochondrial n=1 Tax=Odontomachus brunneus TaxID=486640 RepID=UPI0013F20DB2|nr:28S ribosomal protein S15, mitochondrial [Odontomachus brunneus]